MYTTSSSSIGLCLHPNSPHRTTAQDNTERRQWASILNPKPLIPASICHTISDDSPFMTHHRLLLGRSLLSSAWPWLSPRCRLASRAGGSAAAFLPLLGVLDGSALGDLGSGACLLVPRFGGSSTAVPEIFALISRPQARSGVRGVEKE